MMEWWLVLIFIFGGLILLLLAGLPVSFSFLLIDLLGVYFFWGGSVGITQLVTSIEDSITVFAILPLPLFIMMGEVMFQSGLAGDAMDVINKWLGRLPGRLSIMAVVAGTLFAALTGSAMSGTAMLGSVLIPEMEKRGYKKPMTLGPILGSGGLAIMIPPSALGVLMAAMARFSVGRFLVAIILPGLIMAFLYFLYIIGRCLIQPQLAPSYDIESTSLSTKLALTLRYVLPLGGVIFLVIGLLYMGIATPTEAAAMGTAGMYILVFIFKGIKWDFIKKSVLGTLRVTVMIFMILAGSLAFSQILAYTGISQGLVRVATNINLPPLTIVFMIQLLLIIMGMFMEPLSIMMVTIPILFPIIKSLGLDPLWFGLIMLVNMEMATTSPPFGLVLFVMKGVAPAGTTMQDIYKAALPFLVCDMVVILLIMFYPGMLTWWLPKGLG